MSTNEKPSFEYIVSANCSHSQDPREKILPVSYPAADRNAGFVYLSTLAPSSRRVMGRSLSLVAGLVSSGACDLSNMPWMLLRFQHTQAIRAALADRYSPSTGNRHLSALRGALRASWRLGEMTADDYHRAADIKPIKGERSAAAAGRALTSAEICALLDVCAQDPSPAGQRDAAIIAVAWGCGLRRNEIAQLERRNLLETEQTLIVCGKGNKVRTVPSDATAGRLDVWLDVRGAHEGPLFNRITRDGTICRAGLTGEGVYYILRARREETSVDYFTPHDMRRSFASNLLDAGVDLVTVQKLMGHADVNTTARYDRRGEASKRAAVQRLQLTK